MPIHKPDIKELYAYIIHTHKADHINVSMAHIEATLNKAELPSIEKACVEGHFKAINYAMTLAVSPDFPTKLVTNEYDSHNALFWLRDFHEHIMYPIAQFGIKNSMGQLYIQPSQIGVYRSTPKQLAFAPAPPPEAIPRLLHYWLKDIAELDAEIKDKVENPYGLTPAQGNNMFRKVKESSLFLSCLQPFEDGNNRIAKIVENTLRTRWHMPWRTLYGVEYETYCREMTQYQAEGFLRWIKM